MNKNEVCCLHSTHCVGYVSRNILFILFKLLLTVDPYSVSDVIGMERVHRLSSRLLLGNFNDDTTYEYVLSVVYGIHG